MGDALCPGDKIGPFGSQFKYFSDFFGLINDFILVMVGPIRRPGISPLCM
jgi:hypothetical protein